ncbi:MAG: phosphate signaling complex protein PhoU [Acidimicrobiia bacterium]
MVSSELIPAQSDAHLLERIDDVRIDVVRLASMTADAVSAGTQALLEGDLDAANRLVADDDAVDALRHAIEDQCLAILGRPGLAAPDLRFVGVAMRTAHELERSADLMVNVAKAVWRLFPHQLDPTVSRIIERLGRQAVVQIRVAINAFADRDPSWAAALADMDETIDELEKSLFRHILENAGPPDDATVLRAVQLTLVARHYERIGDHAVTIAKQVHFVVTGEHSGRRRPRR